MRIGAVLLLALLILAPGARGQDSPRVPLRSGNHPDFGRLVFDWPAIVAYAVEEQEGRLLIRFAAPATIDPSAVRTPRNVLGVAWQDGAIVVRMAPGARVRHFRLGNRIVLDFRDAASAAAAPERARATARPLADPPAAAPAASRPTQAPAAVLPERDTARPAPVPALAPPREAGPPARTPAAAPSVVQPVAAEPQMRPAPAVTPTQPAAPTGRAAAASGPAAPSPAAAMPGLAPPSHLRLLRGAPAIAIDAGPSTGLAVFRRGEWVHLVLDRRVAVDTAPLRGHPVFGGLEVREAGEGTALRLPLPAAARLNVRRDGDVWRLDATREPLPADTPSLRTEVDPGPPARMLLLAGRPGGSVTLADPETGETLLVGTMRQPGPAMLVARRLPEFELLPSWLGVAVLARSDRLELRQVTEGRFALQGALGASLDLGPQPGREPPAASLAMTRLMELPEGSASELLERMRNLLLAVQAAPPLARGPGRRETTETLLALGMPQEAQAMASIALQEDPQTRTDPRLVLAHGVAALLSGRSGDARGIDDPGLPHRDEVALWRSLAALARGEPAARSLVATAPLLLIYPDRLRERALPLAAEALAGAGEVAAAASLLAQAGDMPGLGLARAMLLEAEGSRDAALAAYAELAAGRNRRQRAEALQRATELRLAAGVIDQAAAADALDRALFAWRGGLREVAQRRRIAALRVGAGQGSEALDLLQETARLFPEEAPSLRPAIRDAFAAALETAPPLVAATLFDANPNLLPAGERGEAALQVLADRLSALDLPDRAAALLRRAMASAEPGAPRAAIGARLAALRQSEGDAAGALAALDDSEGEGLSGELATRRTVLRARALARRGQRAEADSLLAALGPSAAATRAELRADAQDWVGAGAAMQESLGATLPASPAALGAEDRAAIARTAAFFALAGNDAELARLRIDYLARMEGGPLAEAFGILTSDPLRGVADLPRMQRELGMMRLLPSQLDALRTGAPVAR